MFAFLFEGHYENSFRKITVIRKDNLNHRQKYCVHFIQSTCNFQTKEVKDEASTNNLNDLKNA